MIQQPTGIDEDWERTGKATKSQSGSSRTEECQPAAVKTGQAWGSPRESGGNRTGRRGEGGIRHLQLRVEVPAGQQENPELSREL